MYCVERGAVLYCTARGSTVCFTLDKMLNGPCSCMDTKEKKISASHLETNLYIVRTFRNYYNIQRKGNDHSAS